MKRTDCHIWRFSLDRHAELASCWAATLLNDEERAIAGRFRTDLLARRYIVAHGALRTLLSSYGAGPPAKIAIEREEGGRPWCRAPAKPGIEFSLSHCEDGAMVAIARCRIGADLEKLRSVPEMSSMVRQVFGRNEQRRFERLGPAAREGAFIRAWTLKEAFAKAIGEGLAFPFAKAEIVAGCPSAEGGFGMVVDRRANRSWPAVALPHWSGFASAVVTSAKVDDVAIFQARFAEGAGPVPICESGFRPSSPPISRARAGGRWIKGILIGDASELTCPGSPVISA